ncbi:hypothetical protein AB0B10_25615 [Micromonospora arborensis]|uniref:hypothetical protein n=1 Tax=Micromonospora arborensis TaxID=2116518 RepID=UPI003410902A
MNQYGRQALNYWRTDLPSRFAQIEDPESFFTELGDEMAAQVDQLTQTLAGPDPAQEDFMDKLGRLNAARSAAEEQVIRETLPLEDLTSST